MKNFITNCFGVLFLFFLGFNEVVASSEVVESSDVEASSEAEASSVGLGDIYEVRLVVNSRGVNEEAQAELRANSEWESWVIDNDGWMSIMDARTGLPHRAWGSGVEVEGATLEMRHDAFVSQDLTAFGVVVESTANARFAHKMKVSSHERVFQSQIVEGYDVLLSQIQTKWKNDKLVMWGLDWWADAEVPEGEVMNDDEIFTSAIEGVPFSTTEVTWDGWGILPDDYAEGEFRLVRILKVRGKADGLLRNYLTWVDAMTGRVWYRKNQVVHHLGRKTVNDPNSNENSDADSHMTHRMGLLNRPKVEKSTIDNSLLVISGQTNAQAHAMYPFEASEVLAMPHLKLDLNGNTYFTDENGGFITNETGGIFSVNIPLEGRWSTVYTAGVSPSMTLDIQEGYNVLDVSDNVRESSAYMNVSLIHDHMREWLTEFTGLDFSMETNIDVEGECNAFFDGVSVNFFNTGGGCNPTSLIADVVYHEYGHAINSYFYNSLGAGFNNGAMGEGYSDFWAMSLGDIAEIGKGFYEDNNDGIRRYDLDPKVYPENLVGEVHADGEIIAGAWYDTHLLMGADWDATLALFVDAYPGLQATVPDGDEGQAFTDVLLDVLQADDDDDDLMNGTPNAAAIIEGFAIHGITLFSYATVEHSSSEFVEAETTIEIEAEVDIVFPYSLYFDGVYLSYRTASSQAWSELIMEENAGVFVVVLDGLPAGTVVEYYFEIHDVFGGISGVTPTAANKVINSNLPFYLIVGSFPYLLNDSDDYSDFGNWELGLPSDNSTTGDWEETIPVGSFGEQGNPSTQVAPSQDHTVGFAGYCFLTGVSPGSDAGIGANDVDGGHTTLLSPIMDLTEYQNPVISYWRWYVNAPATGANPATDWWQVEISSDGGSSWQYLENTLQQDVKWRRKAFRIADHVDLTDEFQMRFIASDSTTLGEYLDGGSLIEAALDDIILYDVVPPIDGVSSLTSTSTIVVSPNPSSDRISISGGLSNTPVKIFDIKGSMIYEGRTSQSGNISVDVNSFPSGLYSIQLRNLNASMSVKRFEVLSDN